MTIEEFLAGALASGEAETVLADVADALLDLYDAETVHKVIDQQTQIRAARDAADAAAAVKFPGKTP